MQDNEPQSQDWQQPQQATPRAPYQAVDNDAKTINTEAPDTSYQPVLTTESPEIIAQSEVQGSTEETLPADENIPTKEELNDADETDLVDDLAEPKDWQKDEILVQWQAPEYLHRDRSPLWYAILAFITLALVAVAIFVFNSITFAILVPVMAIALVIYVHRPPAIVDYIISRKGLYVNDRLLPYDQFKSFGVVSREDVNYAVMIPRKRFQLGQNVYFPQDIGEKLVDMLAARLPMKEIKPDIVDKLLLKLHL